MVDSGLQLSGRDELLDELACDGDDGLLEVYRLEYAMYRVVQVVLQGPDVRHGDRDVLLDLDRLELDGLETSGEVYESIVKVRVELVQAFVRVGDFENFEAVLNDFVDLGDVDLSIHITSGCLRGGRVMDIPREEQKQS